MDENRTVVGHEREFVEAKRGAVSNRQSVGLRRPLEQLRNLPPRSQRQKPEALGFELQEDQLFLRQ